MPAILLFHRKTMLGGDDLQPAAYLTMIGRFVQLFCMCTPVIHSIIKDPNRIGLFTWTASSTSDDPHCRNSQLYGFFIVVWAGLSCAYCTVSFVLEARLAHWSSQGTPTQPEPRSSNVRRLLEYKLLPFSVALFITWGFGIMAVLLLPAYNKCLHILDDTQNDFGASGGLWRLQFLSSLRPFFVHAQWWWAAAALLLSSQITEVFILWAFLFRLYRAPLLIDTSAMAALPHFDEDVAYLHYNHELVEDMWAERCATSCQWMSSLTCYIFGGRNVSSAGPSHFAGVAQALADFMESRGVLNIVPSDVVTALIILQRLQKQRIYAARMRVLDDIMKVKTTDSGIVSDGDTTSHVGIRRRTQSGLNLVEQDGLISANMNVSSYTGSEDHLLLPLEAIVRPGISPGRGVHNTNQRQHLYKMDRSGSYHEEVRDLLNCSDDSEMFLLHETVRYAKFALAIYTWVLYLYVHPISGPLKLITRSQCACCCRRRGRSDSYLNALSPSILQSDFMDNRGCIYGDNMCQTHKSSMLLTAEIEESDLIYVQLKSSFSDVPYSILLDHGWKSVVVSIRGTFSLEDCVTDVLIQPECLEQLGIDFGFDATGQHCHGGVMECARNVYRDLERHGLLDDLLLGEAARFPEYRLRLVGHSLGAATCTLLSFMLRSKFPSLRCINYSPPGCTFSWDMAERCKEFCTSCVLDSDLVPRLSVDSIDRLRDEVLELIGRIKVPKIEVASRFVHSAAMLGFQPCHQEELSEKEKLMRSISEVLYEPDEVPDSEYQQQLTRFKDIQVERRRQRGASREIRLYPPGRILHLSKTGEEKSCSATLAKCLTCCTSNVGSHYIPIWIENGDLNEIVVSATMGTDHFPNRIRKILEEVANEFGLS